MRPGILRDAGPSRFKSNCKYLKIKE